MVKWFGYNRKIFLLFFHYLNLVILGIITIKVNEYIYIVGALCAQLIPFYPNSLKLYSCFDHGLEMNMWFVIIIRLFLSPAFFKKCKVL